MSSGRGSCSTSPSSRRRATHRASRSRPAAASIRRRSPRRRHGWDWPRASPVFAMVPPHGTDIDVGPFRYLDERDKVEALARMYPSLDIRFIAPERIHPTAEDDTCYFVRANLPSFDPVGIGSGPYLPEAVAAAGHRALLIGNYGKFRADLVGKVFSCRALPRAAMERVSRRAARGCASRAIADSGSRFRCRLRHADGAERAAQADLPFARPRSRQRRASQRAEPVLHRGNRLGAAMAGARLRSLVWSAR